MEYDRQYSASLTMALLPVSDYAFINRLYRIKCWWYQENHVNLIATLTQEAGLAAAAVTISFVTLSHRSARIIAYILKNGGVNVSLVHLLALQLVTLGRLTANGPGLFVSRFTSLMCQSYIASTHVPILASIPSNFLTGAFLRELFYG